MSEDRYIVDWESIRRQYTEAGGAPEDYYAFLEEHAAAIIEAYELERKEREAKEAEQARLAEEERQARIDERSRQTTHPRNYYSGRHNY